MAAADVGRRCVVVCEPLKMSNSSEAIGFPDISTLKVFEKPPKALQNIIKENDLAKQSESTSV